MARAMPGRSSPDPKKKFFKDNSSTTGTGVQAYRRTGVQAQGLGLGCLVFNSHSRRRAKRGGGSAAPPGTSVLDHRARSVQSLCPKSLSKVSAQSLCPKSLSTPSKSSPGRALSASAAHLGAPLGLLARLLVEKVGFQNVFQQISKNNVSLQEKQRFLKPQGA